MWVGTLALVGFPGTAGFFSKDAIIEATWASPAAFSTYAFWLLLTAAVLTAFYSGRLMFMTFHGEPRADRHTMEHVHESPPVMTVPLVVLAIGAVLAGWVGRGMLDPEGAWWAGALLTLPDNRVLEALHHVPALVKLAPLFALVLGLGLAWLCYIRLPQLPDRLASSFRPVYRFLVGKWYFDELYDALFVRPALRIGNALWRGFDLGVIDRFGPDGVAVTTLAAARRAVRLQTGYVYHYAFAMLIGIVALLSWYLFIVRG
jgi:NADH-quinone oxidoreductase subunit L